MVNVDTVRTVMGFIGNVISFVLFLSPAATFWGIYKKKDTEKFHPYPYLATLLNCALWVFYGSVHPDSMLVQVINSVGIVFQIAYLLIFFIYTKPRNRKTIGGLLVAEAAFMSVIVACTKKLLHTSAKRSRLVGIICIVLNIAMYGSPCSNIITVIRKKSSKFVPFWLCVAGFLNGCCWFAYGFLKTFDINIVLPNGIGAFLSAIMVLLCFIYTNKDDAADNQQHQTDDVKPPKNVQLADVV